MKKENEQKGNKIADIICNGEYVSLVKSSDCYHSLLGGGSSSLIFGNKINNNSGFIINNFFDINNNSNSSMKTIGERRWF